MTHGSLFSGIRGFELAADWMGWKNIFSCEINEFCNQVGKHYFPQTIIHTDIKTTDFTPYANAIDILTGGFPCQPYSAAGKRLGKEDERHLWPEMRRAIREIRPRWIVGENVFGLVNWSGGLVFHEVQTDLEAAGYQVWPFILPAAAVDAPHRRDRVWFVAHASCQGLERPGGLYPAPGKMQTGTHYKSNDVANPHSRDGKTLGKTGILGQQGSQGPANGCAYVGGAGNWASWPTQPPICAGNDGLPTKLDGITLSKWRTETIKAAGNAIVPQVVYQIFQAIHQYETIHNS